MSIKFEDLGLSINAIKAIEKKGFTKPTFVQEKVIPLVLEGKKDLLVQSQTGTGKTGAFAIPLIDKLVEGKHNQVLILAPTRELAIQLSEEIHSFCGRKRVKIALLYGGQSYESQVKRLKKGAEIVIATPGRLIDHIEHKTYKTDKIDWLILDEVDEMLKAGFAEDMEEILRYANRKRKTLFFSATIPEKINNMAKVYTKHLHKIIASRKKISNTLTQQYSFEILSHDKLKALKKILDQEKNFYGIIFCKSRLKAKHLGKKLSYLGFKAEGLHGDLAQDVREQIVGKFRQRRITILTATDVAARGLDIPDLTHIINYTIPQTADSYVHRIGRTGRAGKEGIAITFITPEEDRKFLTMKRVLQLKVEKKEFSDLENYKVEKIEKEIEPEKKVRLFIALGKKNDMNKEKLWKFIEKNTGVTKERVNQTLVSDTFSFITVNSDDAKLIFEEFKGKKNGKRKLVDFAKEK